MDNDNYREDHGHDFLEYPPTSELADGPFGTRTPNSLRSAVT